MIIDVCGKDTTFSPNFQIFPHIFPKSLNILHKRLIQVLFNLLNERVNRGKVHKDEHSQFRNA